jgi:hypothetical protein
MEPGSISHWAGRSPKTVEQPEPRGGKGAADATELDADSVQTVFYGMAIAMALAGTVAVFWLPADKAPEAEVLE